MSFVLQLLLSFVKGWLTKLTAVSELCFLWPVRGAHSPWLLSSVTGCLSKPTAVPGSFLMFSVVY